MIKCLCQMFCVSSDSVIPRNGKTKKINFYCVYMDLYLYGSSLFNIFDWSISIIFFSYFGVFLSRVIHAELIFTTNVNCKRMQKMWIRKTLNEKVKQVKLYGVDLYAWFMHMGKYLCHRHIPSVCYTFELIVFQFLAFIFSFKLIFHIKSLMETN